jgi:hypothetical protein
MILEITTMTTSIKIKANGIHNGAVTHHHDQSIFLVSFNTRKTINKTVPNPRPFDVDSLDIVN